MKAFLTETYARAVSREYRSRIMFVAAALSCLAFLCAIAFALPTYLVLRARAAALSAPPADPAPLADVEASVAKLKEREAAAKTIADEARMATVIGKVLSRTTRGITLSAISLRRGGSADAISLSGMAATREDLVAFQKSLEAESSFAKVILPVSALAKGKDISFTLSVDSNF
jgi:hypothetical protein